MGERVQKVAWSSGTLKAGHDGPEVLGAREKPGHTEEKRTKCEKLVGQSLALAASAGEQIRVSSAPGVSSGRSRHAARRPRGPGVRARHAEM
mmetsp:Transcript_4469/g.18981  ORF Transcript_4469/g.18981 Transcript_4469/m.18981 type:complete len:92 (+) Transcript_4469:1029-1304(+)